jgi:hypothetical protein
MLINLMSHDLLALLYVQVLGHGVMGYIECTLNNFMHFLVHQDQPPAYAD